MRVKPAIAAGDGPSTGWGNIRQGDICYAVEWRDGSLGPQTELVKVNFPRQDGWKGRPEDLEVHATADHSHPAGRDCAGAGERGRAGREVGDGGDARVGGACAVRAARRCGDRALPDPRLLEGSAP